MTRVLAIIAALWCSSASAYLGTFDPQPYRNVVTISSSTRNLPVRHARLKPQKQPRLRVAIAADGAAYRVRNH